MTNSNSTRRQNTSSRWDTAITLISLAIILVTANNWYLATHYAGYDSQQNNALFAAIQASLGSGSLTSRLGYTYRQRTNVDQSGAYITSTICGACTRAKLSDEATSCFNLVKQKQIHLGNNASLVDAAIRIGEEHKQCELCDPSKCLAHYHISSDRNHNSTISKYWRFDRSSPKVSKSTTLYLESIPNEMRIPPHHFQDIGAYFQERYNYTLQNNLTGMPFVVEYNPGLVAIPPLAKSKLPEEAFYMVSLRVTPANNCFDLKVYEDLERDVWEALYHTGTNHIGLALLDKDYNIIEGHETVLEMDAQLNLKRKSSVGSAPSPTFMDYRLFVLDGHIYLHANANTVVVTQLDLSLKGSDNDNSIAYCESIYNREHVTEEEMDKPCKLQSLYGGQKLEVAIKSQFRTIWNGGIKGKNYALFSIPDTSYPNALESIHAEIDLFPHRADRIFPNEHFSFHLHLVRRLKKQKGTLPIDVVNERRVRGVDRKYEKNHDIPLPSFFNVDAHQDWFPGSENPFEEAHGGACCVSFSKEELNLGSARNDHGDLLVGIGHTKVPYAPWYRKSHVSIEQKDRLPHTHYVSLFYAFNPHPPFQIRARSGYFCLGHVPMTGENISPTENGRFNPHTVLTRNRNLTQNFEMFDCPQIHFVSSFIEKADDPSKTVIGYGLNDCTGRLVEVDKTEVVKLLFPDPLDMLFE